MSEDRAPFRTERPAVPDLAARAAHEVVWRDVNGNGLHDEVDEVQEVLWKYAYEIYEDELNREQGRPCRHLLKNARSLLAADDPPSHPAPQAP